MTGWPGRFAHGLALGVRGMLGKELRSRSRGWRPMWLLTFYLGMIALAVSAFLALAGQASGVASPTIGGQLFALLTIGSVLLVAFITPALTAGAISGERERRTLELLLVTRASTLGLVCGKWLGALLTVAFLLAASLPAFALVYLYGGVPPQYLAVTLVMVVATALAHTALGLLLSVLLKRTAFASVLAYLVVLAVVVGLPIGTLIAGIQGYATTMSASAGLAVPASAVPAGSPGYRAVLGLPLPLLVFASPTLALVSVAGGALLGGSGLPFGGDVGLRSLYVMGVDRATGQPQIVEAWAPWVYHLFLSASFAVACVCLAAVVLAPVKPWHRLRVRRLRVASAG